VNCEIGVNVRENPRSGVGSPVQGEACPLGAIANSWSSENRNFLISRETPALTWPVLAVGSAGQSGKFYGRSSSRLGGPVDTDESISPTWHTAPPWFTSGSRLRPTTTPWLER
jgi:hypothetical protein